jgi:hypothetical protein
MFKRFLTGAVLALATAGFGTAALAGSGVSFGFEGQTAFSCNLGTQHDGGLAFAQDFYACFYSPAHPADFPITPPSTVMAVGYSDTTVTRDDGSVFDLLALDLAAGVYTTPGDTTLVTGFLHGGGAETQTLTLDKLFTRYTLDWTGLDSVVFSAPQTHNGYVAFDNFTIDGVGVPEPAEWVLMVSGLLAAGYMLRRARQLAAVEA